MENKAELLRIAAELKSTADRLIECAKESNDKEDNEEADGKDPAKAMMIGAILKKKMGKY